MSYLTHSISYFLLRHDIVCYCASFACYFLPGIVLFAAVLPLLVVNKM